VLELEDVEPLKKENTDLNPELVGNFTLNGRNVCCC
jgi:hypothetical protein